MRIYERIHKLTRKIAEQCRDIDEKSINKFIEMIAKSGRIFIHGAGRSGLVARAFAMRLMHLGFIVYVVGETITPAVRKGDLFITLSGSGKTLSVVTITKIAKEKGLKIVAITSHADSSLGRLADCVVRIKGRKLDNEKRDYVARQLVGEHEPVTPLGTLFELSSMVFLDTVVEEIMRRYKKSEEHMKALHSELE
ncbi:6-phospho-3-hexuloisomerase [Candidatus Micrarchaeota archaeon]|nr:6-phospho-3-hexuloisomerase [Candidatus Micrarchaeota archaeon]